MRVTHAERDRITEVLREAYAEGQLDEEEFDERLGQAMAAKTRGDLEPLVADLSAVPTSAATSAIGARGEPTQTERLWAMGGHLSGYFVSLLGPLIVLLVQGNSPYVRAQAFQALNYQLNILIAMAVAPIALWLIVTIPIYVLMLVGWIVLPLVAGASTLLGSNWRYPFTYQIVKDRRTTR
ncbi:DUF1707 and DUF4870 domain-containing protein [Thermobifida halotolerans]|uniref:DUF1707 and DUF4870 domain-containing protein n=2 Tax=Thermobifida halotolerans TaxID=483545 RepID=A0A399FVM1_9ACTN|nr:DUF1707 and DUF4870 domain-containing protein [Thermobifida halotolerans]UOE22150.1 DUF1707 and DUF4870 domain-containing protein [Thermobifida halotolerans]